MDTKQLLIQFLVLPTKNRHAHKKLQTITHIAALSPSLFSFLPVLLPTPDVLTPHAGLHLKLLRFWIYNKN